MPEIWEEKGQVIENLYNRIITESRILKEVWSYIIMSQMTHRLKQNRSKAYDKYIFKCQKQKELLKQQGMKGK